MGTYLESNALVVLNGADVEGVGETGSATSVRDDIVLITPLIAKDISKEVRVGDSWDSIVGVVRRHDRSSTSINDGPLQSWEVERPQLALTTVDWSGVDTLLWGSKSSLDMRVSCAGKSW
jgi:hypothetical protein